MEDLVRSSLVLSPISGRVLTIQLKAIAALLVASSAGQALFALTGDVPVLDAIAFQFYVDGEAVVPTLYSGAIILAAAMSLWFVGWLERHDARQHRSWLLLAAVIAWIGIDEMFALHELAVDPMRRGLDIEGGVLHYAWLVPAFVLLALFGVVFLGFLRRLPPDTRDAFVLAGTVYVVGAAGMEMVSGAVASAHPDSLMGTHVAEIVMATIEEGLEMFGMVLFLAAAVRHIERHHPGASFRIGFDARPLAARSPDARSRVAGSRVAGSLGNRSHSPSRADSFGSASSGQSMPSTGSSQSSPVAASGTYRAPIR